LRQRQLVQVREGGRNQKDRLQDDIQQNRKERGKESRMDEGGDWKQKHAQEKMRTGTDETKETGE
jgi:hypothetical protein